MVVPAIGPVTGCAVVMLWTVPCCSTYACISHKFFEKSVVAGVRSGKTAHGRSGETFT